MKVYKIGRLTNGVVCAVYDQESEVDGVLEAIREGTFNFLYMLPHILRHSPDGFEFGYRGSGPSDLSRSILIDYFKDVEEKANNYYRFFKEAFIVTLDGDGPHFINEIEIRTWLEYLGCNKSKEIV